jgi:hypothetical protein
MPCSHGPAGRRKARKGKTRHRRVAITLRFCFLLQSALLAGCLDWPFNDILWIQLVEREFEALGFSHVFWLPDFHKFSSDIGEGGGVPSFARMGLSG